MKPSLCFYQLGPEDLGEAFETICRIYDASIDAAERKSHAQLRKMLRRPEYRFIVAEDGQERVLGFAVAFSAGEFDLLEYLAVDPTRRSAGVGSEIFRNSVEIVRRPVLVEVDSAEEAGPDQMIRRRRVAFYRRLGCREMVGLKYVLPLGENPPPMRLMVRNVAESTLSLAVVRRYVETVYRQVYGCDASDPRIGRMLAGLPDPVPLA